MERVRFAYASLGTVVSNPEMHSALVLVTRWLCVAVRCVFHSHVQISVHLCLFSHSRTAKPLLSNITFRYSAVDVWNGQVLQGTGASHVAKSLPAHSCLLLLATRKPAGVPE